MSTLDAKKETLKQRAAFAKIRDAENYYGRQLRKVARHIGDLINGMQPDSTEQVDVIQRILERYSEILKPWAKSVARRMLVDVARRDEKAWRTYGDLMGVALHHEIANAPTGEAMRELLEQQVSLITSLPLDAAKRVHELAVGQLYSGERASALAAEIMKTGGVTKSRANLIARTETSRAATILTQVRAVAIGSEGYIWRTAEDWKVRPAIGTKHFAALDTLAKGSHRKLNGTFHKWTQPPIAGVNGERAHAGGIYNCRCYPEPVLPGDV